LLLDAIVSIVLGLRKTRDEIEAVYRMNTAQLTRHNRIFELSRFAVNLLLLCHIGLGRSNCFLQLDFLFLCFVV
jgi:protein tyrosine phosphatase